MAGPNLRLTAAPGTLTSNSTRGKEVTRQNLSQGAWHEAQAGYDGSRLRSAATYHSLEGIVDSMQFVPLQEFSPRAPGTRGITYSAQSATTRYWQKQHYDTAMVEDPGDEIGRNVDLSATFREKLMKAEARVIDKALLDAIIKPAMERNDTNTATAAELATNDAPSDAAHRAGTTTTAGDFAPAPGFTYKFKENLYYSKGTGNTFAAFNVDFLADIKYVFSSRNVPLDNICVSLTPELERLLMKDASFKVAQDNRTFMIGGDVESSRGAIEYYGMKFIRVSPDVLPEVATYNISHREDSDTFSCVARDLNATTVIVDPDLVDNSPVVANALTAGDVKTGASVIGGTQANWQRSLIYFWDPSQLFINMDGIVELRTEEVIRLRLAKVTYAVVPCSTMFLQEDYCLVYALGQAGLTAPSVHGSGTAGTERG